MTVVVSFPATLSRALTGPLKKIVTRGGTDKAANKRLARLAKDLKADIIVIVLAQRVAGMERRGFV